MEEETPVEMTPEIMEPEPAADETSVIEDGLEIINEPVSGEEETPATMQLLDTSWGDEDVPVDVMEYHGTELMIDASISDPAEGESLLSVEEQQLLYAIIDRKSVV